jgi:hypothetical protein
MKPKKTLHEAILVVLKEGTNEWTELEAIANAVNERKLYVHNNGQPVTADQVRLRTVTQAYRQMFDIDGTKVRLKEQTRKDRNKNRLE